jgi:hypothetical protein
MEFIEILSKRHGVHQVLLDAGDYTTIKGFGGKWCITLVRNKLYAQKRLGKRLTITMHRFLMKPPKGMYIDHINGNGLDNRRINLRICTNSANLRNGSLRTNNTSGVTGVALDKTRNKWVAKIKVKYKTIHLGRFGNFEEAVNSRKAAEKLYWSV